MRPIYLRQSAQILNNSLQVSSPAQNVKVATTSPGSPEIKDEYGKVLTANPFRQQRITFIIRVWAFSRNTVTNTDCMIYSLISGQIKLASNL